MRRDTRAIGALVEHGWQILGTDPTGPEPRTDLVHPQAEGVVIGVWESQLAVFDGEEMLRQFTISDWASARWFAVGYHLGVSAMTAGAND